MLSKVKKYYQSVMSNVQIQNRTEYDSYFQLQHKYTAHR